MIFIYKKTLMATTYEKYLECNVISDILFKKLAEQNEYLAKEDTALSRVNLFNPSQMKEKRAEILDKITEIKAKIKDISDDIQTVSDARDSIVKDMINTDLNIDIQTI